MLDPKHLIWLAEIVDLGSFSRAARKLGVTQPTLSRAVQVIEEYVGGPVVERERYGVRPTRIGERLAEAGRSVADSRAQAETALDLWRGGQDRELRIGVGPMLAISVMGGFFAEMLAQRGSYGLNVTSATASRLIEMLNSRQLDLVLAPEHINLLHDDLIQQSVLTDRLGVFAGPGNALAKASEPLDIGLLQEQRWIVIGALSGIYGSQHEIFAEIGNVRITASISFTGDITMAAELLRHTEMLCILPSRLAANCRAFEEARELDLNVKLPSRNIAMWSHRTDRHRPDIIDFHERLCRYIENHVQ